MKMDAMLPRRQIMQIKCKANPAALVAAAPPQHDRADALALSIFHFDHGLGRAGERQDHDRGRHCSNEQSFVFHSLQIITKFQCCAPSSSGGGNRDQSYPLPATSQIWTAFTSATQSCGLSCNRGCERRICEKMRIAASQFLLTSSVGYTSSCSSPGGLFHDLRCPVSTDPCHTRHYRG